MGNGITYISTAEGWLYLAVLMAVWQRAPSEAVILHSDGGTQYTINEYQEFLRTHGIVSSMSGVGNCYDNAVAESFFGP